MSDKHTKVLLIEDNPGDVRLIQEILVMKSQAEYQLECADRLSTGLEHLVKGEIDVVLLDLSLPDSQGLDTLSKVRARAPAVPIVVVTGLDDEALALQAVRQGAQDYLVKGDIDSKILWRVMRYAMERKRLEKALQERVKELDCLYGIERIAARPGLTVDEICQEVVNLLPKSWQYQDIACARITLGKKEFRTDPFNTTEWKQSANINVKELKEGTVEVYYLEVRPELDEGPFQKEERLLIDAVAGQLGGLAERKQAEDLFRSLALSSPVGIYIVKDRRFQFVNPQFQKDIGYSENELLGMDSLRLVIPEDRDMVRENAVGMLKGERSAPYEYIVTTKGGDIKWVLEIVTSIKYRGARAALGYFVDTTERKKMQSQLIQAEKMSALGTMAAGVAHELLNPMMGILNFAQYCLKHTAEGDPRYPVLQDIERETRRCSNIVRNLTTFSRMGKQDEEGYQKESLATIIDKVIRLLSYRVGRQRVSITQHIDEEVSEVWARTNSLQQVLLNLINNALDAVKESEKKEIRVEVHREGDFIQVTVADSGCGLTPERLERIYDPFFTTKPVGQGTGLGLTISRSIVNSKGGVITCKSKLGEGTTFKILLPMKQKEVQGEHKDISD